jgi:biopolymer transport protein ExbD
MRRPAAFSQRDRGLDVMMTPMIDVVFLLLIFFLWTAGFQIAEQVLPSSVSTAPGTQPSAAESPPPPEADFDDVVIRILWSDGKPAWRVNQTPVATLAAVRQTLASLARIKSDTPVILHPDPGVPLGHVIDLYDITRLEGFQKVQFAASEKI